MTVQQLHELTGKLIAKKKGNADVAIDFITFAESENGNIHSVSGADFRRIQGADDSGPIGRKFPFLVLSGPMPSDRIPA